MTAIVIPKFIDLEANAKDRAISAGVSELNGREALTWANLRFTNTYGTDNDVFATVDYWLGSDYNWSVGPVRGAAGGGTLVFEGSASVELVRIDSSATMPSRWARK